MMSSEHIYTRGLFVVYLETRYNWSPCLFSGKPSWSLSSHQECKAINLGVGVEWEESAPTKSALNWCQNNGIGCFVFLCIEMSIPCHSKENRMVNFSSLPCSTDVHPEHALILKGTLTARQVTLSFSSAGLLLMLGAHYPVSHLKYTGNEMCSGNLFLWRGLFFRATLMFWVQRPLSQVVWAVD